MSTGMFRLLGTLNYMKQVGKITLGVQGVRLRGRLFSTHWFESLTLWTTDKGYRLKILFKV